MRFGKAKIKVFLISTAFFFISSLSYAVAEEIEVPFKVRHGKIEAFGYILMPKVPLKGEDEDFISFDKSPNSRWITIVAGDYPNIDVWLYDAKSRKAPVRVNTTPGRHVFIKWHGDEVIEVYWAGMGYQMSDLFKTSEPNRKTHIDDLLYYDKERLVYVRYYFKKKDDKIHFFVSMGRAFAEDSKEEHFVVGLDPTSLVDAVMAFEDVEIIRDKLIITHKRQDSRVIKEEFKPGLLQQKK